MSMTALMRRPAAERTKGRSTFRPMLDVLEDRTVPASLGQMNLPLDVSNLHVVQVVDQTTQAITQQIQGVVNFAGQAAGTFAADLTTQAAADGECPILDLHIGAIHLDLLGLNVDTSNICLDVTATHNGGLLGDLLCGLTNADLGLGGVGGILDQLDGVVGQVDTFLGQIEHLLDGVLGQTAAVDSVFGSGNISTLQNDGHCDILSLSLGPVNLDVLGVSVDLDDCAGGPVTVDITGEHGPGNLLGNLLCGLADGLNGINPAQLIGRLDGLLDRLGGLADRLGQIADAPQLVRRLEHQVDALTRQLENLADRVDDLAGLDRLLAQVDRVTDRLDRLIDRLD